MTNHKTQPDDRDRALTAYTKGYGTAAHRITLALDTFQETRTMSENEYSLYTELRMALGAKIWPAYQALTEDLKSLTQAPPHPKGENHAPDNNPGPGHDRGLYAALRQDDPSEHDPYTTEPS